MGRATLLAASLMLLGAGSSWAKAKCTQEAGGAAAIVTAVQGKPVILRAGKKEPEALKRQSIACEGDRIKTGSGDLVALAMMGGVEVRINANSEFTMEDPGGGQKPPTIFTSLGQAFTRRISAGAGIRVRTPPAVAAVRGTEADIYVPNKDRLGVDVFSGEVALERNGREMAKLTKCMSASVSAGQAPKTGELKDCSAPAWQSGLKVRGADRSLRRLTEEAERRRKLKLRYDGKEVEIELEK